MIFFFLGFQAPDSWNSFLIFHGRDHPHHTGTPDALQGRTVTQEKPIQVVHQSGNCDWLSVVVWPIRIPLAVGPPAKGWRYMGSKATLHTQRPCRSPLPYGMSACLWHLPQCHHMGLACLGLVRFGSEDSSRCHRPCFLMKAELIAPTSSLDCSCLVSVCELAIPFQAQLGRQCLEQSHHRIKQFTPALSGLRWRPPGVPAGGMLIKSGREMCSLSGESLRLGSLWDWRPAQWPEAAGIPPNDPEWDVLIQGEPETISALGQGKKLLAPHFSQTRAIDPSLATLRQEMASAHGKAIARRDFMGWLEKSDTNKMSPPKSTFAPLWCPPIWAGLESPGQW